MSESRITALDAIAVPTAVEPKSRALSSPTTAVIPSKALSSAAVLVTPSRIFNSAAVEFTVVPFIDNASVSNVPSISALLDISNVAATSSPVIVKFLTPV